MSHLLRIRKNIFFIILSIALVIGGAIFSCGLIDSSPDLVWTMVNVNTSRQGDAHVIQVKKGKTVLIDAGLRHIAQEQLIPFLENNKIRRFDIVFISHPHKDHYGGILPILKSGIKINEIYFNIPDKGICDREIPWGCEYKDVLKYHQILKDNAVEIKVAKAGQKFDLGNGATIKILYAFDGVHTPVGKTDINDLSLIMMLEQFGHKMLFTGDLNRPIGGYLARNAHDIQAEVLKVPHHGTEGCAPNSFFKAVNPKYALVPSPRGLWCSKRSLRIRDWFKKNQVTVFVNGFHGNVKVEIQNRDLNITPEKVPRLYIKVAMTSSVSANAQVYFDIGNGLHEKDSAKCRVEKGSKFQILKFPLPCKPIQYIRFDPLNAPGTIELKEIKLVDECEGLIQAIDLKALKPLHQINSIDIKNDILKVITDMNANDPMLYLNLQYPIQYAFN